MIYYSTVNEEGRVILYGHTTDPNCEVPPGCRLLLDAPPEITDENYRDDILVWYYTPVIPVPATATEIEYVLVRRSDADLAREIDNKRKMYLGESDWTQLMDTPLSEEERLEWAKYRQGLRDLPKQPGFPSQFKFPERPKHNY